MIHIILPPMSVNVLGGNIFKGYMTSLEESSLRCLRENLLFRTWRMASAKCCRAAGYMSMSTDEASTG